MVKTATATQDERRLTFKPGTEAECRAALRIIAEREKITKENLAAAQRLAHVEEQFRRGETHAQAVEVARRACTHHGHRCNDLSNARWTLYANVTDECPLGKRIAELRARKNNALRDAGYRLGEVESNRSALAGHLAELRRAKESGDPSAIEFVQGKVDADHRRLAEVERPWEELMKAAHDAADELKNIQASIGNDCEADAP